MMKLFRRIFRMALLPVLLLVFGFNVSAVEHWASTPEELLRVLSYASGRDNVIYLTQDIDASGVYLQTKKDTAYVIRSDNDSALIDAAIGGTGSVTIEVELPGSLTLEEFVTVTVNGDIGGFAGTLCEGNLTVKGDVKGGLNAEGSTVITVEGNVSGFVTCLREGKLTVLGDVNGELTADNTAVVNIGGNVNGNVSGYRSSLVEIAGNVTSESTDKWAAVYAHKYATIRVKGNVTGKGDGISAQESAIVNIGGNVTAGSNFSYGDEDYIHGGTAVTASGKSVVVVSGSVYGGYATGDRNAIGGHGISAWSENGNSPTITIKRDVLGGNAWSSSGEPCSAQGGIGISTTGGAKIYVGGHVLGGTALGTEAVSGVGARITCEPGIEARSLKVIGSVAGGKGDSYTWDMEVVARPDPEAETQGEFHVPTVQMGNADSVQVSGFGSETNRQIKNNIVINIQRKEIYDNFWDAARWRIKVAKNGATITLQADRRTEIPVKVIQNAQKKNITLIIQWNGGRNVLVNRYYVLNSTGPVSLARLPIQLNRKISAPERQPQKPVSVKQNILFEAP